MQVEEIPGGISNLLWKLEPKLESGLSPVVARIFGEQPATMSREREEDIVLQMNQHGFGAPVSCPTRPGYQAAASNLPGFRS